LSIFHNRSCFERCDEIPTDGAVPKAMGGPLAKTSVLDPRAQIRVEARNPTRTVR